MRAKSKKRELYMSTSQQDGNISNTEQKINNENCDAQFISINLSDNSLPTNKQDCKPNTYSSNWKLVYIRDIEELSKYIVSNVWSPCAFFSGYRKEVNFRGARYAVLDFDEEISMRFAEENVLRRGLFYIIAPTLSHQRIKIKGKQKLAPCDRFRLILKFEHVIKDLKTYKYNMRGLVKNTYADASATDGARLFFHSIHIDSLNEGKCIPVEKIPDDYDEKIKEKNKQKINRSIETGELPDYIKRFLYGGLPFCGGVRHKSIVLTAFFLKEIGKSLEETYDLIKSSPFDRSRLNEKDIDDKEIFKCLEWVFNKQ
jgi:hypothetical protein